MITSNTSSLQGFDFSLSSNQKIFKKNYGRGIKKTWRRYQFLIERTVNSSMIAANTSSLQEFDFPLNSNQKHFKRNYGKGIKKAWRRDQFLLEMIVNFFHDRSNMVFGKTSHFFLCGLIKEILSSTLRRYTIHIKTALIMYK